MVNFVSDARALAVHALFHVMAKNICTFWGLGTEWSSIHQPSLLCQVIMLCHTDLFLITLPVTAYLWFAGSLLQT